MLSIGLKILDPTLGVTQFAPFSILFFFVFLFLYPFSRTLENEVKSDKACLILRKFYNFIEIVKRTTGQKLNLYLFKVTAIRGEFHSRK